MLDPPKFKDIKGNFNNTDAESLAWYPTNMKKWYERTGGELHPKGYNFLGPRSLFVLRNIGPDGDFYEKVMSAAGLPLVGTYPYDTPINFIDRAAFEHDRVYSNVDSTADEIREADEAFIAAMKKDDLPANVYELATQQIAGALIRLKTMVEDVGTVRKGIYSESAQRNFTRAVYGRNETMDEDIDHSTFWGIAIDTYLRGTEWLKNEAIEAGLTVGSAIGITLASRLAQRRRIPYLGGFVERLARMLSQNANPNDLIRAAETLIEQASEQAIQHWFDSWGVPGELVQMVGRFGVRNVLLAFIDKLPDWIISSIKSDTWLERSAVTEADIERVMERRLDTGRRPDPDLSVFRDAMTGIANQTPRQRINNVLAVLRTIRDVNPTITNKINAIRTALEDARIFQKIRLLRGTSTLQVIRSILREKVPNMIARKLVDDFRDALLFPGENEARLRARLSGMTFVGLISQMAMLSDFADLLQ